MDGLNPTGERWTLETLKQYFEAILEEQRLAIRTADEEREKSAAIVRESLREQITAADLALAQHVNEQVQQIRQIIELNQLAVEAAFAASEKAISKAEAAAEKRFESVNEFRGQLSDQTKTFLPRETFEAFVNSINDYKEATSKALTLREGQSKGSSDLRYVIFASGAFVAAVVGIVVVIANFATN